MTYQGSSTIYGIIRFVLFIVYKALFGFQVRGAQNVPPASDPRGVIFAPNHESYIDPPLTGISQKRRVTYLAKEYLFKHGFVGWVLRSIGAYPVHSEGGNDFKSIRDLVRLLKAGRCVTVFPEGTRSPDGQLQKAEGGIGFLALKSGAWVVPVFIDGTFEALPRDAKKIKRGPVKVLFGKAFVPAEDAAIQSAPDPYQAVGDRIMQEIRSLKDSVPTSFGPARQSA